MEKTSLLDIADTLLKGKTTQYANVEARIAECGGVGSWMAQAGILPTSERALRQNTSLVNQRLADVLIGGGSSRKELLARFNESLLMEQDVERAEVVAQRLEKKRDALKKEVSQGTCMAMCKPIMDVGCGRNRKKGIYSCGGARCGERCMNPGIYHVAFDDANKFRQWKEYLIGVGKEADVDNYLVKDWRKIADGKLILCKGHYRWIQMHNPWLWRLVVAGSMSVFLGYEYGLKPLIRDSQIRAMNNIEMRSQLKQVENSNIYEIPEDSAIYHLYLRDGKIQDKKIAQKLRDAGVIIGEDGTYANEKYVKNEILADKALSDEEMKNFNLENVQYTDSTSGLSLQAARQNAKTIDEAIQNKLVSPQVMEQIRKTGSTYKFDEVQTGAKAYEEQQQQVIAAVNNIHEKAQDHRDFLYSISTSRNLTGELDTYVKKLAKGNTSLEPVIRGELKHLVDADDIMGKTKHVYGITGNLSPSQETTFKEALEQLGTQDSGLSSPTKLAAEIKRKYYKRSNVLGYLEPQMRDEFLLSLTPAEYEHAKNSDIKLGFNIGDTREEDDLTEEYNAAPRGFQKDVQGLKSRIENQEELKTEIQNDIDANPEKYMTELKDAVFGENLPKLPSHGSYDVKRRVDEYVNTITKGDDELNSLVKERLLNLVNDNKNHLNLNQYNEFRLHDGLEGGSVSALEKAADEFRRMR